MPTTLTCHHCADRREFMPVRGAALSRHVALALSARRGGWHYGPCEGGMVWRCGRCYRLDQIERKPTEGKCKDVDARVQREKKLRRREARVENAKAA